MPILLSFLSSDQSPIVQTSTGDFLKAIITISANASQHEQSCIGPNDLTRQLVSEPCIKSLIQDMLKGGNALTVGVGIIIEVIRKNNSDYDPENLSGVEQTPSSRDPIYLGNLLRRFASHVPDFMELINSQNEIIQNDDGTKTEKRRELRAAHGGVIEPLGFNRFKTCELMAELLHCSNMALLNEKGSDLYVKERDAERNRLKAQRGKGREAQREAAYSQDLGGFRFMGVMGEKGPLEVQNGDDNSSEGTTEDDGFEDVGIEGLLIDEEIRPLRMSSTDQSKGDIQGGLKEDDDVDLLLDEPEQVSALIDASKADEKSASANESASPPITPMGPPSGPPLPIPTLQITSPTDENPDTTSSNLPSSSGPVEIDTNDKVSPPLPTPPTDDKPALDASESGAQLTGEEPNPFIAKAQQEQRDEPMPSTTEESLTSIPKPPTPPPPYGEVASDIKVAIETEATSSLPSSTPSTIPDAVASSGRIDADLPPLPADTPAAGHPLPVAPVSPQVEGIPPATSPFNDPPNAGDLDDSGSIFLSSLGVTPNFREGSSYIEDEDGTPVVGDYLKMQFVEHRVVVTILDFFFRFPWNNFLHNVVYDVVQQVFNGRMDRGFNRTLAIDLFETGRITERIMEGQRFSDKTQQETRMRMGYMGHLTLIAEEVVKFTENNAPEVLSQLVLEKVMHPDWIDYVENVLAKTRERDNAILGGYRPDQSLGPRVTTFGSGGGQGSGGLDGLGAITVDNGHGFNSSTELDNIDLANGTGGVGSGGSTSFNFYLTG